MTRTNWVLRGVFGRVSQLEMTASLTTHTHPQLQLLARIDGAPGLIEADNELISLTEGQAVLLDSWEPHGYRHAGRGLSTTLLVCHLEPSWLAGLLATPCPVVRNRRLVLDDHLLCALHALVDIGSACADGGTQDPAGVLESLVHALGRSLRMETNADPVDLETRAADQRLIAVIRHMRNNMDDRLDIDRIAARFGLSRPHLYHLFSERLGQPPHVCWNALRMEYALRHLGQARRSGIKQIAFDLGFNSQSNFTRFFQSIQGLSPRAYQAAASQRG